MAWMREHSAFTDRVTFSTGTSEPYRSMGASYRVFHLSACECQHFHLKHLPSHMTMTTPLPLPDSTFLPSSLSHPLLTVLNQRITTYHRMAKRKADLQAGATQREDSMHEDGENTADADR